MSEPNKNETRQQLKESHKKEVRLAVDLWLENPNKQTFENMEAQFLSYALMYLWHNGTEQG